ncbi:nitroreductase [Chloroflexota bacterium]
MELAAGIRTRRSIRAFKATPIPGEIIEGILEAASRSPSYTNTQPWEVAVVSGEKKDELSKTLLELAGSNATPNPDLPLPKAWPPELEGRAREHGARRLEALGVERENKEQREALRLLNFKFYGAPCVLFLFIDRTLSSWSVFDTGLFTQSLILAVHSSGLGSCLQASVVNYPDAIRECLGIPETKLLVLGISLGYPDLEAPINSYQSSRVSPDDFTKWYV